MGEIIDPPLLGRGPGRIGWREGLPWALLRLGQASRDCKLLLGSLIGGFVLERLDVFLGRFNLGGFTIRARLRIRGQGSQNFTPRLRAESGDCAAGDRRLIRSVDASQRLGAYFPIDRGPGQCFDPCGSLQAQTPPPTHAVQWGTRWPVDSAARHILALEPDPGRADTIGWPGHSRESSRELRSDQDHAPHRPKYDTSAAQFEALFASVCNWGRWGAADERGALNELSLERVLAATKLVQSGETVTLSLPLNTESGVDNPKPAEHRMTMLGDVDIGSGSLRFAKDYIGVDYHNESHSHIDALCHVAFKGALYNGRPADSLTADGASVDAIGVLANGLVGRGVLLDVPRLRGISWLEPGEHVFPADLEGCEREQGVVVSAGDILLVRVGHARRLSEHGAWDMANAKAGLHPSCARFLADRGVSVLGSDGNNDTAPSTTEGIDYPIHALALNAMGIHLLDYLQFEDLVPSCERNGRWEFLLIASPLRISGGTGSPLNPIAIL